MINRPYLPSIDQLLQSEQVQPLREEFGHDLLVNALRQVVEGLRQEQRLESDQKIIKNAHALLRQWSAPTLIPVINASGIILHTNLGRAPLSEKTFAAMHAVAVSYNNLEFDLERGKRGKRALHAEQILTRLTGAESAYVVNNNAAAVLLVLAALANRKRVLVSRSQMVEIGGGFRVPDVMRQSGAKLVEIGTTNRLHLYDYENALQEAAALVLCAHHSNFKIVGFAEEPSLSDICAVAHAKSIPVFHDLGSGALLDTAAYGLAHEPTVQESLQAGVDVLSFSGDKLMGGPQAGIIIGRKALLDKIKKHPLARALRPDKLCLAGVTATLLSYLSGKATREIPVWQMISRPLDEINQTALKWKRTLSQGEVIPGESMVGGGSLPGESLPTALLALQVPKPDRFMQSLRRQRIPIIARIEAERVLFDPRTVLPHQEAYLLETLQQLLQAAA
ncbi:MAG: L-seryl-tRNA(Sec) selenium transferase [Chloroflexi bacterium]|nr:L-seryl-tRNA(Sec) selenium transferase [Chloroflexota bacterium]